MFGVQLIEKERREQLIKHNRTVADDVAQNADGQLSVAAGILAQKDILEEFTDNFIPTGWDETIWRKMLEKPYFDRLIIAGALIAAELDRLQASDSSKSGIGERQQ